MPGLAASEQRRDERDELAERGRRWGRRQLTNPRVPTCPVLWCPTSVVRAEQVRHNRHSHWHLRSSELTNGRLIETARREG
jgi:hypothetical protein